MAGKHEEIKALIADLNCRDVIKCQNARRALVQMGEIAVEPLKRALHEKNHWTHWEAVKALSQIASPSATEALVDLLEHEEFDERWIAAEGLVSIGLPAILAILNRLLDRPQSIWLRQGAHHVFSDVRDAELRNVLLPVINAIEGTAPSVEIPPTVHRAIDSLRQRIH